MMLLVYLFLSRDLLLWLLMLVGMRVRMLVLMLQLLEVPLTQHRMFSHGGLSQTVNTSVYGRYVPPRIGVHMIHTTHGEGPILILVVRVGSGVEVIAQVIGGKVHIGGEESPFSKESTFGKRGAAYENRRIG